MRVQPALPVFRRDSLKAFADGVDAPGKSSDSATLGGERQQTPHRAPRSAPRFQVELVCRDDTKANDPFWDGPRLIPAFVTQLLGQVMAGGRTPPPRAPYRAADGRSARLVDTRA